MIENIIGYEVDEKSTVMIHGTSVEAALALLKNGRMERVEPEYELCIFPPGYLYFRPNPEKFRENPDVIKASDDFHQLWKECLNLDNDYAVGIARRHHIISNFHVYDYILYELSYVPNSDSVIGDLADWQKKEFEKWVVRCELMGFSRQKIMSVLQETSKRKGVMLCINENIFEHPYEPDPTGESAFRMYFPNGFDIKYVSKIIPQGIIERELLLREIA
jgi:hypothetical protein